jgi:tetratricopeptide (TPR) repeat protein
MERQLVGKQPTFHPRRSGNNFYRVMLLLSLILSGVWLILSQQRNQIQPLFLPTPTPTRTADSYIMEAQAYFAAGKIDDPSNNLPGADAPSVNDAIEAYQAALEMDSQNAQAWIELARIQAYSSTMLRNDTERFERLQSALEAADKAIELMPDESTHYAIRAFVKDWYAFNSLIQGEERQLLLLEAERDASRAFQLDPNNALALAYYAEILADQGKWAQAEKYAAQAVSLGPDLMDTHRVYGYVLETLAQYNSAIQQYQKAADLSPNMTFLYIRIGQNYREGIQNPDRALDYFDRAAKINEQLGVQNPQPYIEIAKTYTQQGQFYAATVNAQKALEYDSTNAHTYGQLGIISIRARNYEGAVPLLRCAVLSCTAAENEMGGADVEGLPLSSLSVAYYYVEFGTVLAFLSRPAENYCGEALMVLQQVRDKYSDDPTLMSIVEDSEGICRRLGSSPAVPSTVRPSDSAPTATPSIVTPAPADSQSGG